MIKLWESESLCLKSTKSIWLRPLTKTHWILVVGLSPLLVPPHWRFANHCELCYSSTMHSYLLASNCNTIPASVHQKTVELQRRPLELRLLTHEKHHHPSWSCSTKFCVWSHQLHCAASTHPTPKINLTIIIVTNEWIGQTMLLATPFATINNINTKIRHASSDACSTLSNPT